MLLIQNLTKRLSSGEIYLKGNCAVLINDLSVDEIITYGKFTDEEEKLLKELERENDG